MNEFIVEDGDGPDGVKTICIMFQCSVDVFARTCMNKSIRNSFNLKHTHKRYHLDICWLQL